MILPEDLDREEDFWIIEAQKNIVTSIRKDNLAKLNPRENEKGIIIVGGRTECWMQMTWNRQQFILLPKNHPVTDLIIAYDHRKVGHLGSVPTIAKIRSKFFGLLESQGLLMC